MRAVKCTFSLNNRETSTLHCSGIGPIPAFSGQERGRDNPAATAWKGIGPIPKGTYYIVDRQSGGMACITVLNPSDFWHLERYLRSQKPNLPVPGTTLKAYGTVEVR
ncbi:tlde1 domain-containing protein [Paraburkholderia sp. SIMBA_030]|uniref:tlde1 domain-containing protein n=1 Tax=Paraburkholderia sp. SIMBA_030 TaxID=3085773 RepID=UPI00397B2225